MNLEEIEFYIEFVEHFKPLSPFSVNEMRIQFLWTTNEERIKIWQQWQQNIMITDSGDEPGCN